MKNLYLATGNLHKVSEIKDMLSSLPYQIKSLRDFDPIPSWVEDADSFRGNALIKAEAVRSIAGHEDLILSDDSGLVVPSLDGAPGVYSARYAGEGASDRDNFEKLLKNLEGSSDRKAYFVCCLCLLRPALDPVYFEGMLHGTISSAPSGEHGFGYDPVFVIDDGRHLAELSVEEKNQKSHRAVAMNKLKEYFLK